MKLRIEKCYSLAWKSFARWWIPICLVSGLLFVFEIAPRILMKADEARLEETIQQFVNAASEAAKGDPSALARVFPELQEQVNSFARKTINIAVRLFPSLLLLFRKLHPYQA